MTGDWFAYAMIALNVGACVTYGWQGNGNKALYWAAVTVLNVSLLRMR